MEAKSCDVHVVFRSGYAVCGTDPRALLLDVRSNKEWRKGHLSGSFNIRLSTNGRVLAVRGWPIACCGLLGPDRDSGGLQGTKHAQNTSTASLAGQKKQRCGLTNNQFSIVSGLHRFWYLMFVCWRVL